LRDTAEITIDLNGASEDQELPSQEILIQHTPNQGTMKARMDV